MFTLGTMSKTILEIPSPIKDTLTDHFISLYQVLAQCKKTDDITFNFSHLEKCHPLIVLPLCCYISEQNCGYSIPKGFDVVGFPKGTNEINLKSDAIPILFLSNTLALELRDKLINDFVEKLYRVMGQIDGTKDAIIYPLSELITNIFEHSCKEEGWVFAQLNSEKSFLDICVVDSGRGLRESYKQEQKLNISDEDAIGQVIIGNSTKPDKERGYGVRTSKKLICKGLKGSFLIFSGKAALISEYLDEKLVKLDKDVWGGVILAYRIPLLTEPVDIYPYIE